MLFRIFYCGLLFFSSLAANAEPILNSDQINMLKIERQNRIKEREFFISEIVTNEKKIEMLLEWANGDKPNTITDKVAPAASAIVTGGAATAIIIKHLPEVISKLPLNVQRVVKVTPALAGLVAAVYFGYDSVEYQRLTTQITSLTTLSSRQAMYILLVGNRDLLAKQIELLTKEINSLDAELNMYE